MDGTTWKKRSRQALPEERKVPEPFSVKPMGGRDPLGAGLGCGAGAKVLICGGPTIVVALGGGGAIGVSLL